MVALGLVSLPLGMAVGVVAALVVRVQMEPVVAGALVAMALYQLLPAVR
jgi:hypothetical protein